MAVCFVVFVWASIEYDSRESCASQFRRWSATVAHVIVGCFFWHQSTRRHFIYFHCCVGPFWPCHGFLLAIITICVWSLPMSLLALLLLLCLEPLKFSSLSPSVILLRTSAICGVLPPLSLPWPYSLYPEHHFRPFPLGFLSDRFTTCDGMTEWWT